MNCVIYSNCQADGLALFLPKMGFPYKITVFRNYQLILGEQKKGDLEEACKTADLFIHQPTDERHNDFSSQHMISLLPKGCPVLSFAYVYNHGMFPLVEHGKDWRGSEFIDPVYWQMELPEVLYLYDQGSFDFALIPRFLHCLAEQARRERDCDVKLAEWMMDHRHRRLLLAVNHPTTLMFIELARQIMLARKLTIRDIGNLFGENDTNLPCSVPHSNYVTEAFHMGRGPDPDAHDFYRQMLSRLWQSKRAQILSNDELFGG